MLHGFSRVCLYFVYDLFAGSGQRGKPFRGDLIGCEKAGACLKIALPVPDILSVCKAEEGDDAVASLTNDNAADGKIDGAESAVTGRMEY